MPSRETMIETGWDPGDEDSCSELVIFIDGKVHLSLAVEGALSFQAWIQDGTPRLYCIEYYFDGREVLTEYESREIWERILADLQTIFHPSAT